MRNVFYSPPVDFTAESKARFPTTFRPYGTVERNNLGDIIFQEEILTAVFVRHPLERIVSALYQKLHTRDWTNPPKKMLTTKWMRDEMIRR